MFERSGILVNMPARLKPGSKKKISVTIQLDHERDDHGDFFVVFVIRSDKAPEDFTTFGSRDVVYAQKLAKEHVQRSNMTVARVVPTEDFAKYMHEHGGGESHDE